MLKSSFLNLNSIDLLVLVLGMIMLSPLDVIKSPMLSLIILAGMMLRFSSDYMLIGGVVFILLVAQLLKTEKYEDYWQSFHIGSLLNPESSSEKPMQEQQPAEQKMPELAPDNQMVAVEGFF